jgi:HK97 gp10 family phage protein
MVDRVEMHVEGFKEIEKMMRRLPASVSKKHARRATRQGIALVRDHIKQNAPIRDKADKTYRDGRKRPKPGRLRRLVRIRSRRGKRGYLKFSLFYPVPEGTQGDNPKNAFYWRFVEFGTKYIPANPFIQRAVDRNFPRIVRKVITETNKGLREELAKAGVKRA